MRESSLTWLPSFAQELLLRCESENGANVQRSARWKRVQRRKSARKGGVRQTWSVQKSHWKQRLQKRVPQRMSGRKDEEKQT